jgi:hypothetical protein
MNGLYLSEDILILAFRRGVSPLAERFENRQSISQYRFMQGLDAEIKIQLNISGPPPFSAHSTRQTAVRDALLA